MSAPGPFVITHGGNHVPVLNPATAVFALEDIAYHLARLNRFTGAGISVAQHSLLVAARVEVLGAATEVKLHALLHDAPEMLTGDIPAPLKAALAAIGQGEGLRQIEQRIATAVAGHLLLPEIKQWSRDLILVADLEVRAAEIRDLFPHDKHAAFGPLPKPWPDAPIEPWSAAYAEREFLGKAKELLAALPNWRDCR